MKVILTQDVKGRGKEGDIIDVARGFAVNFLMPRKIAIPATAGNIKQLEARMGNIQKRETARRGDAEGVAAAVEGKKVVIVAKASDEGKLYGSITSAMIVDAVAEQLGVEVDRKKLDVHAHIKVLGEHAVQLNVYYDVKATLIVQVVAEGAEEVAAEEPVVEDVVEEAPVAEEAEEATEDVAEQE